MAINEEVRIQIIIDGATEGARDVNLTDDSIERLTASLAELRNQGKKTGGDLKQSFSEIKESVEKFLQEPLESVGVTLEEVRKSQSLLAQAFAKSGTTQQRKEIALLAREVDNYEKQILEAAEATAVFGKQQKATAGVTNASNFAFIQLGRGIEDLRFGAVNAVNNIEPVITAIGILKQEAAAAGTTVTRSLVASLTSPAGLLFAGQALLTLAVVLGPKLSELFSEGAEEAKKLREEVEELVGSIIEVTETELKFRVDPGDLEATLEEIEGTITRVRSELAGLQTLIPSGSRFVGPAGAGTFTTRVLTELEKEQKGAAEDRLAILKEIAKELEKQVIIQNARKAVEEELAAIGELVDPEAERDAERRAEELARNRERLAKLLSSTRVELIEDELRRSIAATNEEFQERIRLARLVNDPAAAGFLESARLETIRRLRDEARQVELEAETAFFDELTRLDEEFRILRGESEETILNERLDRIDQELDAANFTVKRERELLLERADLVNQLQEVRNRDAEEEEKRSERLIKLRDKELSQTRQFGVQLQQAERALRVTLGEDRLEVLQETEAQIRGQLQLQIRAAREEERLLAQRIEDEEALLRARIRNAQVQQQLQLEILSTQQQIAREEKRILDERARQIQQFTDLFANSIIEFRNQSDSLTNFDIEAQNREFRLREAELRESLRRNLIDQQEYSFELRQLQQDRSQFEQQVEEERAGFLRTLGRNLTDFLIEEGLRQLSAFIARQTAELLFSKGAQAAATASTVASMTAIGAAAAPAAAATSIATFGASAAAGGSAATAAILSITALVASLQAAGAVTAGFKEGGVVGYTGDGSKHGFAGFVHGGEYVFPEHLVRGQLGAFRMLHMSMQTNNIKMNDLLFMLGMRGFQTGGFVDPGVVVPAFSPASARGSSSVNEGIQLDALRSDVGRLATAVSRLASRPNQVVVSPFNSRQITKAASLRESAVRPRRFRK